MKIKRNRGATIKTTSYPCHVPTYDEFKTVVERTAEAVGADRIEFATNKATLFHAGVAKPILQSTWVQTAATT